MIKAFTNINELAEDRQLITPEICQQNDFYGHATVIKNYIGWQKDIPLPFVIEHGAYTDNFIWDVDINSPVPAILCGPTRRVSILQSRTAKRVESVGPPLQYVSCLLTEEQISVERKRLGKNLLVFPAHSTHHMSSNYDVLSFIKEIKSVSRAFDSVRVCLYWKDVLRGVDIFYEQAGIECVSAGHIYDPIFLPRLKSLLSIADMTMSNSDGSHVGFSLLMGKPHYLWKQPIEVSAETKQILQRDCADFHGQDELAKQVYGMFSVLNKTISTEQWEFADDYWGIGVNKDKSDFVLFIDTILRNLGPEYENLKQTKEYFYDSYLPTVGNVALADKSIKLVANYATKLLEPSKQMKVKPAHGKVKGTGELMIRSIFKLGNNHYGDVMLTPVTLAQIAMAPETWSELLSFHQQFATDEYLEYVDAYYREAVQRFGRHWHYLDISNTLFSAARMLQPETYLEIGVRKGRSACMVTRGCPSVDIVAFDMWVENYAGMDNPGPDYVKQELLSHGHKGNVYFINGDSHITIPEFFKKYPDTFFDMITVDGDHSEEGAYDDLCNVIPHLSVGGVLVFDDIAHPAHPYLLNVWRKALARFSFIAGYEYTDAGFGVAFAIRKT